MSDLQLDSLPHNFKVYEMDDYKALNCSKESKELLDVVNSARKEGDVQNYIKKNGKWFIPLSILKAYDFGHHFSCVVPEYSLGAEYRVDYLLIGKNSVGYHFVFVEFEDVNVDYTIKSRNSETEKVRKGIDQIRDWKRWMTKHKDYFMKSDGIKEFGDFFPDWMFKYCLVVSRRERMNDIANDLRGEMSPEITIMPYDRLVDYVGLLHNGI